MKLRSSVSLKRIFRRLQMNMTCYNPTDGTHRIGYHDTMISVSSIVQNVMEYIAGKNGKQFHGTIRAVDLRHVMLLMPFVMQDLLMPEVEQWNETHSVEEQLHDPSNCLVDILCDFLEWYTCFRKPEHTLESIVDLDARGRAFIEKCKSVFPNVKTVEGTAFYQNFNDVLMTFRRRFDIYIFMLLTF